MLPRGKYRIVFLDFRDLFRYTFCNRLVISFEYTQQSHICIYSSSSFSIFFKLQYQCSVYIFTRCKRRVRFAANSTSFTIRITKKNIRTVNALPTILDYFLIVPIHWHFSFIHISVLVEGSIKNMMVDTRTTYVYHKQQSNARR